MTLQPRKSALPADLAVVANQTYLCHQALLLCAPEASQALAFTGLADSTATTSLGAPEEPDCADDEDNCSS